MNDKLILNLGGKVVEVTQDDNNRYSLNDLFRASGQNNSKAPSRFMAYRGKELDVVRAWERGECRGSEVFLIKEDRATITYAKEEILYEYLKFVSKDVNQSNNIEEEMEKSLVDRWEDLFPNLGKPVRQYKLYCGDRVDILSDSKDFCHIVEIKIGDNSGHKQLYSYATYFDKPVRLINISQKPVKVKRHNIEYYTYRNETLTQY